MSGPKAATADPPVPNPVSGSPAELSRKTDATRVPVVMFRLWPATTIRP